MLNKISRFKVSTFPTVTLFLFRIMTKLNTKLGPIKVPTYIIINMHVDVLIELNPFLRLIKADSARNYSK